MIDDAPAVTVAGARGGAAGASLTELDGRRVACFRLAGGKHRGALGLTEGEVIERLVTLALDVGVPIVGELASSGADVMVGLPALHAWGRVVKALTQASALCPSCTTDQKNRHRGTYRTRDGERRRSSL